MQLVEVEVMRLGLDRSTNSYVVILQEKGGARLLPIWIGQPEAESIVIEMNKLKRERPLTHDLCKNLIIGMGGTLRRVNITKVENRTFYAELHIARNSGAVHIDARPSDSIAIALRFEPAAGRLWEVQHVVSRSCCSCRPLCRQPHNEFPGESCARARDKWSRW